MDEGAFGALPLLDVITACAAGCERKFGRVNRKGSDRLFVVGELGERFACGEVPKSNGASER